MKRISYMIILLFLACYGKTFAQSTEEINLAKYWHYRDRFVHNFISVGPEAGQSLPFATRNEKEYPILNQGEGGIMLGYYLGILATEYALLSNNNAPVEQTLKELYYAMYAFNRLDLKAETVNGYNKPATLDGFFIREDYPEDFIEKNPGLNRFATQKTQFIRGKGTPLPVKCTTDKGRWNCYKQIDRNCKVKTYRPKGYCDKYEHAPMSLDQMLGMLLGVSLVHKLLPENINYRHLAFQDGETSLNKEAQNIARRIISYAAKYNWTPKEPDGYYIGDCKFTGKSHPTYFKNNATLTYFARYIAQIGKNIFGEEFGYFPLIDVPSGFFSLQLDNLKQTFYHRRMFIEMMVLSNRDNHLFRSTRKKVILASRKYNWEAFYFTLGKVLHGWKNEPNLQHESLHILSSAPYDGPYFHGVNDLANGGWATDNRWSASLGAQYNGSRFPEYTGNYSGVDYMLFYNLYLLAYDIPVKYHRRPNEKKSPINTTHITNSTLEVKKCIKGSKQICKERSNYYNFLKKFTLKNCKEDAATCRKKVQEMYRRKFGPDFDINKETDCSYKKLEQYCKQK